MPHLLSLLTFLTLASPLLSAPALVPIEEGSGVFEEVAEPTPAPTSSPIDFLFTFDSHPSDRCYPVSKHFNFTLDENADVYKMMGRWFVGLESAGYSDRSCVIHEYGRFIKRNHVISFEFITTYRDRIGLMENEFGYAFSSEPKYSMLKLISKEYPQGSALWIYKVGPEEKDSFGNLQYEYVIVSNCRKRPVTVLVRNPETFKKKYRKEVLRWLEDQDFKIGIDNPLVQPAYSSCYYADSISERIGY